MPITKVNEFTPRHNLEDHHYTQNAWRPQYSEYDASDMETIGEIPKDVDGVYLRNTETPIHGSIGLYHPFDGDGMIHSFSLKDGVANYCNRFVRTKALQAELEAGEPLWAGVRGRSKDSKRPGWGFLNWLKDSSSTDVIVHAGKLLTTFYHCGDGYRLDPYTLEQHGTESWVPLEGISAHTKLDENTGELFFFNYSAHAPYIHYGIVDPQNKLVHYEPVPFPGPRAMHDISFTENFVIFNDLPMHVDEEALHAGVSSLRFHKDKPSRFAILPRRGTQKDIQWFEADPTYVLHWTNAYEDGDEIVVDGYFQENPTPALDPKYGDKAEAAMHAMLDLHSLSSKLHRWRFNLKTGETKEEHLCEDILEFGTFNRKQEGRYYRYVYSAVPSKGEFTFSGLQKNDLETGEKQIIEFGEGRYGSEPQFAPRINAKDEDDGYIVSFISDVNLDRSEFVMLDAKNIEAGPVCQVILPERISSGTHSTWAHGEDIRKSQKLMKNA